MENPNKCDICIKEKREMKFKINDQVKSKISDKIGIIQATYDDDMFLVYDGKYYEHLYSYDMEKILK